MIAELGIDVADKINLAGLDNPHQRFLGPAILARLEVNFRDVSVERSDDLAFAQLLGRDLIFDFLAVFRDAQTIAFGDRLFVFELLLIQHLLADRFRRLDQFTRSLQVFGQGFDLLLGRIQLDLALPDQFPPGRFQFLELVVEVDDQLAFLDEGALREMPRRNRSGHRGAHGHILERLRHAGHEERAAQERPAGAREPGQEYRDLPASPRIFPEPHSLRIP